MNKDKVQADEKGNRRLSQILGSVLCAVLVFTGGYSIGRNEGEKVASSGWATELVKGIYAADDSYTNSEAAKRVDEAADRFGKVKGFTVERADGFGTLIVTQADRNGVLYEEIIHLQGGHLRVFSSMPVRGE